jgi:DNA-directed RNA polymerase sigma subunit (sigma70/sigma32)
MKCPHCGNAVFSEQQLRGNRKLSPELARVIRLMRQRYPEITTRELGRQFDVSHTSIRLVLANAIYAERPAEQERAS